MPTERFTDADDGCDAPPPTAVPPCPQCAPGKSSKGRDGALDGDDATYWVCLVCGLVYRVPDPIADALGRMYRRRER